MSYGRPILCWQSTKTSPRFDMFGKLHEDPRLAVVDCNAVTLLPVCVSCVLDERLVS
jgi:hypothetical protein